MAERDFEVVVARVGEGMHEPGEFSVTATSVIVSEDGELKVITSTGSQTYPASSWGAISITRVPSAKGRI